MPGEARYAEEWLEASETLTLAGLQHYEVSNFAQEGEETRHNWLYWDGSDYLGLGPSAHRYLAGERVWNVFRWDRYRETAASDESLREGQEFLDRDQRRLERIWLDLRTIRGLDARGMIGAEAHAQVESWRAAGWVEKNERLRLTPAGWLRLDELATEVAGWQDQLAVD